jgi:Ca-activated chloride channel family protein
MTFGSPTYLYGLLLIPAAIVFLLWAERQRRRATARVGEPALIARLSESVNTRGRRIKLVLWIGALALLIISMARPQWGETKQSVAQKGVQVMVALDVSKSMLAQDLKPDRLTRAKMEINELMNHLNGDEVGLTAFSGASFVLFPLTSDYNTARSFLDSANPGVVSRPGTAIGEAIRTAMRGFDEARNSQKVIVVMTDGEDNQADVTAAAQEAAKAGVMVYTIGFGSSAGDVIPEYDNAGNQVGVKKDKSGQTVVSTLNEQALRDIAAATGGQYYPATADGSELDALAAQLNGLQKGDIQRSDTVQRSEQYQWFLAPALALLIAGELISDRKSNRRSVAARLSHAARSNGGVQ